MYVVAALYRFCALEDAAGLRAPILARCERLNVVGTLLLATEGINGTIAGSADAIEEVLCTLRAIPGLEDLREKRSWSELPPFHRMKVKLKKEIVTMGDAEVDPTSRVGTYVDPRAWDKLLDDPKIVVLDTRNDYETRVGMFEGAIDPKIRNFRDFPRWTQENLDPLKTPKVAMYCTGGIRCEKASSLLLREGFQEVYHLEGGILRYLEATEPSKSRWQGECFVFDHRVALDAELNPGSFALCYGCLEPLSEEDRQHPDFEYGVTCPFCFERSTERERAARRERMRQMERAQAAGLLHIGQKLDDDPKASFEAMRSPVSADGVLYSFRRCPYAIRARMALAATNLDPEIREVALKNKPPELLALGKRTVPVWQVDGQAKESLEIMDAVLSRFPDAMLKRNGLSGLIEAIDGPFKASLDHYKYPSRYEEMDPEAAYQQCVKVLQRLESELVDSFLDGPEPGFNDAAVFPFVRQFAGVDAERFDRIGLPRVVGWKRSMSHHPWFMRVMRKLKPWTPESAPVSFQASILPTTTKSS